MNMAKDQGESSEASSKLLITGSAVRVRPREPSFQESAPCSNAAPDFQYRGTLPLCGTEEWSFGQMLPSDTRRRIDALLSWKHDERLANPATAMKMLGPCSAGYYRTVRGIQARNATARTEQQERRGSLLFVYLRTVFTGARKNAIKRSLEFSLTEDDIWKMLLASRGRCVVTGIAFDLHRYRTRRAPFAPSIDRIDCAKGYTLKNVRLTCQIANLAMNVWGDAVLREFIERAASRQKDPAK